MNIKGSIYCHEELDVGLCEDDILIQSKFNHDCKKTVIGQSAKRICKIQIHANEG